jgi:hypothetical protein
MAANRTFRFYGIGYGNTPVTVTARVNSTEIFSGEIPTIDQPIDPYPRPLPAAANTTVAFSLTDSALLNTDFAGSVPMTITVSGGYGATFSKIDCNYYMKRISPYEADAGQPGTFGPCYRGVPANPEGTLDSRSSVVINGVAQTTQRPLDGSWDGTWYWLVPTGTEMSCNWNIGVGQIGNVMGDSGNYIPPA